MRRGSSEGFMLAGFSTQCALLALLHLGGINPPPLPLFVDHWPLGHGSLEGAEGKCCNTFKTKHTCPTRLNPVRGDLRPGLGPGSSLCVLPTGWAEANMFAFAFLDFLVCVSRPRGRVLLGRRSLHAHSL